MIFRIGAWRATEPPAEFSGEICIVAKATGMSDLADRLDCVQQHPAPQQTRGLVQTNRMYEMTAGKVPRRKELLKVTQRDSPFDSHLARTEIWIGIAIPDDIADTPEQFIRMKGGGHWV
jgi:hypothetical protein